MTLEELLDIFHAEPTKLTKDELIQLGKSLDVVLDKRKKEATMIEEISEAITGKVEESEESEESEEAKTYSKVKRNPFSICGIEINKGFVYKKEYDKLNLFKKKFNRALELGLIVED